MRNFFNKKLHFLTLSRRLKAYRFLAAVIAFPFLVYSSLVFSDGFDGLTKDQVFDLKTDPVFSRYQVLIERLAQKQGTRWAKNDFCAIGVLNDSESKALWVIWSQGKKIYLWEGQDEELDMTRRSLDLRKDVVNTEADLHGSTYLVTKAWVDDIRSACDKYGEKVFVVTKKHSASRKVK